MQIANMTLKVILLGMLDKAPVTFVQAIFLKNVGRTVQ